MSELGVQMNELGDVEKQKQTFTKWIENTENTVAEYLQQPPKYRYEALQADMKMISNLQEACLEKHSELNEISPYDNDLKIALDNLDGHISMLMDKRVDQQVIIEDYRGYHQDCLLWLEKISKSLLEIDENQSMNSEDRLQNLQEITSEYGESDKRLSELDSKYQTVLPLVGDMDKQQINEQMKSVERRIADLRKRIERKKQIFEMAQTGYIKTKEEIEETENWIKVKNEELHLMTKNDMSLEQVSECKNITKEIESKVLLIESLETKIETISTDLEQSEYEKLKQSLISVFEEQKKLQKLSKAILKNLEEGSETKKKIDTNFTEVQNWLKSKTTEFSKNSEYDPLKSSNIEKKIALLKKEIGEVNDFEESKISQVKLGFMGLQKNATAEQKEKIEIQSHELEAGLKSLKEQMKSRVSYLEDELDMRRDFETELDKCVSWIDQAETILTTEVRGTINIAILDDHHNKFKRLKKAEEENRECVTDVFETASKFLDKLSDADRIFLQTQLDDVCDKQNHVADTINAKISSLVRNIDIYKSTAQKIEDSVNHLTEIQTQIRLLNKPIGYRVEDAEDVLEAYGKILDNLKAFKIQMEDLQKTAGTNVTEVRALLGQQEELISAIENQMVKIRTLITIRHQFMTMVTGITSFIIKHTEVVKQVERSSIPPMEKVKKYDESILKLKDCETQLSLASDKGQQIANEGSAADRNQISHQLQSLKTQILALKKAIEKKRDEHIKSVQEHNKIFGELEKHLDWIQEKEAEVKERPLLTTTVEDVENNITLHKQLTQGIMEYVEKIRDINEAAKKEQEIPVAVFEMLSRASALIQTMPRELEERKQYLENNKNYRLQYDSLVERLNSWIEEAQIKLRPIDSGVDYENLTTDLEEHKTYFSQESKLKELLHNIHDIANKIWASLAPKDQDKINHEQEFLTQLVKNTLNSAHSRQTEFEDNIKKWKSYCEIVEKVKAKISECQFDPEVPTTLPGVKTSIQKIDAQIKQVDTKKTEIEQFSKEAKIIENNADSINRHKISESSMQLQNEWKKILSSLKEQKEHLATLALQWEDFDQKFKSFESQLTVYHQQYNNIETTFTSVQAMKDTKKKLVNLLDDVRSIEGKYKDVQILSDNVIRYV